MTRPISTMIMNTMTLIPKLVGESRRNLVDVIENWLDAVVFNDLLPSLIPVVLSAKMSND
jgi:hypothetical protein